MKIVLASILLMVGAVPARASDWWFITVSENGYAAFDGSSLVRAGSLIDFDFVIIKPAEIDGVKTVKNHTQIDCVGKTIVFSRLVGLNEDGAQVQFDDTEGPLRAIRPGSIGETMRTNICKPRSRWSEEMTKITTSLSEAAEIAFLAIR